MVVTKYYLEMFYTYIRIEGVAETSQIFLRDGHVLPKLLSLLHLGVSAIDP
jgi:hypothetical protein